MRRDAGNERRDGRRQSSEFVGWPAGAIFFINSLKIMAKINEGSSGFCIS
jgi:hypothetical protein